MVNHRLRRQLVSDARQVLREILRQNRGRWFTSYSLWAMIDDPDLKRRIESPPAQGGYGRAIGKGGGDKTGPAHGISAILGVGRTENVVDDKLDCDGMVFHGVPVSPNPIGTAIFRWQD